MPSEDVTKDNEETVRISTFLTAQKGDPVKIKHLRYRFKIGDRDLLTHLRNIFTRQYDEKWTGEIFTILLGRRPSLKIFSKARATESPFLS
jgi:hypothetical protein